MARENSSFRVRGENGPVYTLYLLFAVNPFSRYTHKAVKIFYFVMAALGNILISARTG
jgi:hypothetical protein